MITIGKNDAVGRAMGLSYFLLLALVLAAPATHAAVWYVNAASTVPTPDGTSWATAFPTLQPAVDAAATGDELWVAAGTYTSTGAEVVKLKAGITLYGGFAATETDRSQRNWAANVTIVDGEKKRRCVTVADATGVVDGCTMHNGKATDGGGVQYGVAKNCTFIGNSAVNGAGMQYGTAINCIFSGNSAGYMGGGTDESTVANCTFAGNTAKTGGGISKSTAVNCIFWGNTPNDTFGREATFSCFSSLVKVGVGCIVADPAFVNPWAGDFRLCAGSPCVDAGTSDGVPSTDVLGRRRPQGAGVDMGAYEYYPGDDDHVVLPPAVLRVNVASTATAPDGLTWGTAFSTLQEASDHAGFGTELWVVQGTYTASGAPFQVVSLKSGTLMYGGFLGTESTRDARALNTAKTVIDGQGTCRCVMVNGSAQVDGFTLRNARAIGGSGGGMNGGLATNCIFSGNLASDGGGMYCGTAMNCTFTGNSAGFGGGMHSCTATNCIVWGNAPDDTADGNKFSFCCLSAPMEGTGNIVADPQFVDPWAGDFRLCSGSRCVDAGTSESAPAIDLLGRKRPQGAGVDMGAYEYCSGDDDHVVLPPAVLRVNVAGAVPAPDGLTWETAFSTLQEASDHAGFGTEIWVAKGTYKSDAWGWRVVSLAPGVSMYGGFSGTESIRDAHVSGAVSTFIDGQDRKGCVAAGGSALVEGFTLQHGFATRGGGLYGGTAINCTFTQNRGALGGGMYGGAAANCNFLNNVAEYSGKGGGMYGGLATDCDFTGNTAKGGGGMYEGTAVNCVFAQNAADDGGGMEHGKAVGCTLESNSSNNCGGGMYYGTAANCTFAGNRAEVSGGGMAYGTSANCVLMDNVAPGWGGGVAYGAAADCIFTRNHAGYGGGTCYSELTNCTFTENLADKFGGGTYSGTAINCIFNRNSACYCGGGAFDAKVASCTLTANTAVSGAGMYGGGAVNCIVWGNTPDDTLESPVLFSCLSTETAGVGNIAAYPKFVDPLSDDFRLRADSPCVDAGTSADGPATDLLGRVRPQGAGVDMGAYEYYVGDDDHARPFPPVLRVNAASTAAIPDGLTWETAFPTLQGAASSAGVGTEIWVAQGVYYAAVGYSNVLWLPLPGIAVYGGFGGTETTRDARGVNPATTVIDGQRMRRCVEANRACLVDGFTLRSGKEWGGNGGGMTCGVAINCIFTKNATSGYGGGLYRGIAVRCAFMDNDAYYGGGMYEGFSVNCIFTGNYGYYGGGMCYGRATNCTMAGNRCTGRQGSAIYSGTAKNCIIVGTDTDCAKDSIVTYSCISNWVDDIGNITLDPRFVNSGEGDFRLRSDSPCIDTGTRDGAPAADMLGVPRPQGMGVDMGAYEAVQVPVPDLSGLARTAARELVAAAQLYVRNEAEEYHAAIAADHVIRQAPGAGVSVPLNTPVDLVISKGPHQVPDLSGLARSAAKELIVAAQLYVAAETEEYHPTVPSDHVIRQTPAAGVHVPLWAVVDLVISKGPQPVPVPGVVGQTRDAAVGAITDAGLAVGTVTLQYNLTIAAGTVLAQTPAPGTIVMPGTGVDLVVSRGGIAAPNVVGRAQSTASTEITTSGLVVGNVTQQYCLTVPTGSVISQSVAPGTPALPGTVIDLVVSKGGIAVPGVVGQAQSAALTAITNAGLAVGTVTHQYSATAPVGSVLSQTPSAGTPVLPATAVNLTVSRGVQPSVMPDVVGQPLAQAESALTAAGLALGLVTRDHSDTVAAGSVISQSPEAGTSLPPGTVVSVVVSLGPAPAAEGEGEPVNATAAQQKLTAAYAAADSNGDGMLSFTEASAAVAGLSRGVFNELDANGDGQLSVVELGVEGRSGCAGCQGGKSAFGPADFGKRLGDLFLMVLGTLGLAAMSTLRRP